MNIIILGTLHFKALVLGDLYSCFLLGEIYSTGEYFRYKFSKNFMYAQWWYIRAARRGHLDASYELGFMYLLGEAGQKDVEQGLHWMKKAAEKGHQEATKVLINSYTKGEFGVVIDESKASYWSGYLKNN